jgi:hypothetical protein
MCFQKPFESLFSVNYAYHNDAQLAKAPLSQEGGQFIVFKFTENRRCKSRSQASSHLMEFLNRVFSNDGASRFHKTFILRFAFDSNKTPDDSTGRAA